MTLRFRTLGKSNLNITEIGFGLWPLAAISGASPTTARC